MRGDHGLSPMPLASLGLERHQYIEATGEPQAEAYEDYYAESSHLAHDTSTL